MLPSARPAGPGGALALLWLGWAVWLLVQPALLASDDALFFADGLSRFSVLDFSPHFPGYPGFIALGRMVWALSGAGDAAQALFFTSVGCVLALPWVAGWAAGRGAFAATLACPLLPAVALSLLSDGAGLLFLLLGLGGAMRGRPVAAALALGGAVCCRPSIAVPALAALVWLCWTERRRGAALLAAFAAPCLLAFGVVLVKEGWAYGEEGMRFLAGHVGQWGNTALARHHGGWGDTLAGLPLGWPLAGFGLLALWQGRGGVAGATLAAGLIWTVALQNPDNPRHLAPLAVLAVLAARSGWLRAALATAGGVALLSSSQLSPAPPPLAAARSWLAEAPPGLVLTNQGVTLLRRTLPTQQVADVWYGATAAFLAASATGPVYRLTGSRPDEAALRFAGRVPGEADLFLIYTGEPLKGLAVSPLAGRGLRLNGG